VASTAQKAPDRGCASTPPVLQELAKAGELPAYLSPERVCKPLSIAMSLRDLPMASMDFENSGHEILLDLHEEILI
jgi:hypothetical protein